MTVELLDAKYEQERRVNDLPADTAKEFNEESCGVISVPTPTGTCLTEASLVWEGSRELRFGVSS